MVKTCCVKNCDIGPKEKIKCFSFPHNRYMRQKWIDAIGLSSKLTADSTVCIRHFQDDDYDMVRGRPRLKAKVVPSVFNRLNKAPLSPMITEDDVIANEQDTDITHNSLQKDKFYIPDGRKKLQNDVRMDLVQNECSIEIPDDSSSSEVVETCTTEMQNEKSTEMLNDDSTKVQNVDSTKVNNECRMEQQTIEVKEKVNDCSADVPSEKSTDVLNESSEEKLQVPSESPAELANEDKISTEVQNKMNAEVQDEVNTEVQNKVNTEIQDKVNTEVQDKVNTEVQDKVNTEVQDKVNTEVQIETGTTELEKEGSVEIHVEGRTQNNNEDNEMDDEMQLSKKSKPNGIISNERNHDRVDSEATSRESIQNVMPENCAEDLDEDIEEIIVNYQIKQTRPVHAVQSPLQAGEEGTVDLLDVKESDPVFIEVAVKGRGDRAGSERDCLMVLESVQVELDPRAFLHAGDHPDDHPDADDGCPETVDLAGDDEGDGDGDDVTAVDSRQDPISLLTSSDEDEVVIEEPHIDTVEVSDETDEDDVPLVRLLAAPRRYHCAACRRDTTATPPTTTTSTTTTTSSTVLRVCQICDYTTASGTQYSRHRSKHKEDKKYKCHLCDYKARHNMSLVYHLKTHRQKNVRDAVPQLECHRCGLRTDGVAVLKRHLKLCGAGVPVFTCRKCGYETRRALDLRRHRNTRHRRGADRDDDDDDDEP